MLIGEDFPRIQFDLFGLHLGEPNTFIGDALIFLVALILARKVKNLGINTPFFNNWYWFLLIFGFGFFVGGFGHLFFNYTGIPGKYPALYLGLISTAFLEKTMISLHPKESIRKLFGRLIYIKLTIALISATLVFTFVDLYKDPSLALVVSSINGAIGSIYALGYLGLKFAKSITPSFHYIVIGVVLFIPTALVQSYKISLHQWFDRNDISHALIIVSLILYYFGIKGFAQKIKLESDLV
ncbi:MAG: hypothetical protein QNK23_05275 [Crocinitomicaceae bacterium]|nr:hypothetical protein [Crocinitomicaceae bacterium]